MRVADFISDLKAAGFSVTAQGLDLVVMPASKLTDPQRQFIRQHKTEIMTALRQEQPSSEADLLVEVWTPSGTPMMTRADSLEHAEWLRQMNPKPADPAQMPPQLTVV
jgi:hypothetical protein